MVASILVAGSVWEFISPQKVSWNRGTGTKIAIKAGGDRRGKQRSIRRLHLNMPQAFLETPFPVSLRRFRRVWHHPVLRPCGAALRRYKQTYSFSVTTPCVFPSLHRFVRAGQSLRYFLSGNCASWKNNTRNCRQIGHRNLPMRAI